MQRILNDDFAENSKLGEWSYKADASLLAEIPEFQFDAPEFKEVISANTSNLLILTTWLLVSFGFLFFASTRI